MQIKINVYKDDMKTVKKEVTAETTDIPFGIIRRFMNLFNIKDFNDTSEVFNVVTSCWAQITKLLNIIFPDMTEEDFDTVKTKELIAVVIDVLKYSFKEMLYIPVDQKN